MSQSSAQTPRLRPGSWTLPGWLPGLTLAVIVMVISGRIAVYLGGWLLRAWGAPAGRGSPISAMSVAIVLGMIVANTTGVSGRFQEGLQLAIKRVLRFGIILVGLKMSFFDVLSLGVLGVPAVAVGMAATMAAALGLARWLCVGSRFGILVAASTAVCGVTATVAMAPVIEAEDREVAYTVANVSLFGLAAMLTYPYLAHWLFPEQPGAAGMFLGMGIHDTSQVMGAALSYREIFDDEVALKAATVTKLTRNVFLVVAVPLLGWVYQREQARAAAAEETDPVKGPRPGSSRPGFMKLFPTFVLGFLAMAIVRSLGDAGLRGAEGLAFGLWDAAAWKDLTRLLGGTIAYAALGTAMAAVGLTTRFALFRGVGPRPFYLGAAAALAAGICALLLSALAGPLIQY